MHPQHQQQQRSSFYRANRPGNLNIVEINESLNQVQIQHSPLINTAQQQQQVQQQQQQMLMPPSSPYMNQNYSMTKVHQSPLLGPPLLPPPSNQSTYNMTMSAPNQQSNYIPPPISPAAHFNQKLQQQLQPSSPSYIVPTSTPNATKPVNNFQPPYSPSYSAPNSQTPGHQHIYNTNTNASAKAYEQQTYTPNYSPIQSSANLINKQTQFFNFDLPNISSNNTNSTTSNNNGVQSTIPQSPRVLNTTNSTSTNIYSVQQNKLASNSTNLNQGQTNAVVTNTGASVMNSNRYTNGTYSNPSNFASNTSGTTNSNIYQFQHNYHKMPSTPQSAIPITNTNNHLFTHTNHHSLSVPNSPLINNNNMNNTNASMFQFNLPAQQNLQASLQQDTTPSVLKFRDNDSFDKQPQQQQDKLDASYEDADVDEVEGEEEDDEDDDETTNQMIEETKSKQYGENEIEMVEQVLNDMMQKEESIKDNISSNSVDSTNCEINNANSDQQMLIKNDIPIVIQSSETTSSVMHEHYNQFEQPQQQNLNDSNESVKIIRNKENNKIMNQNKLDNISPSNNITSSTNIESNSTSNSTTTTISNKTPMYSLSNLSAAASAEFEFMLNYNNNSNNNANNESHKDRIDNENFKNLNNKNNNLSLINNTSTTSKHHNESMKVKHFSDSTSEFHKQFSLNANINNNNKKSESIEFKTSSSNSNNNSNNSVKKEANNYDHQMKMSIDNPFGAHTNENSSFNSLKQSIDRDINSKFSVLDQQNLMNSTAKRSNASSVHSDDFGGISSSTLNMGGSSSSPGSSNIQNCHDCGKKFTNKSALAKHRLIHSNERKYACHLCDKSFKRQDHLNGHLLTHQDKKPFECKAPGCDKSYCDSRSLKRHVESQHQDYLEAVARGNHEVLNYLPNIGKLKANLAPNLQHEIIVNDHTVAAANSSSMDRLQYSPITPVINLDHQDPILGITNRPKNFFTFEEPKPEICRICGKGFKNIPALNGHMRLHGGFIKTKANPKTNNNIKSSNDQLMNNNLINSTTTITNDPFNEDSMSSNCSSTNSFSNSFQSINDLKNLKDTNNNIKSIEMNEASNLTGHFKQTNSNLPSYNAFNSNNSLNNNNNINATNNNNNNLNTSKIKTPLLKPKSAQKTIFQKLTQRNLLRKLDNSSFRALDLSSKSLQNDDSQHCNDLSEDYDNESDSHQHHSSHFNHFNHHSSQISNQHDIYSSFHHYTPTSSNEETRYKPSNQFYDNHKLNFTQHDDINDNRKLLLPNSMSKIKANSIDNSDANELASGSTAASKFISNLLQHKQNSFDSFMSTSSNTSSSSFGQSSKSFLPPTSTSNLSSSNTNSSLLPGPRLFHNQNTQNEDNTNANKLEDFSNSYKHVYPQSEANLLNSSWSLQQNVMKPKVDCLASTNASTNLVAYSSSNETQPFNSANSISSNNSLISSSDSATPSSSSTLTAANSAPANKVFNSIANSINVKSFVPYNSETNNANNHLNSNDNNYESHNNIINDTKSNDSTSTSNTNYTNILRDAFSNALMRNHQMETSISTNSQVQSNNITNNTNNNMNNLKQKIKPGPLNIPSAISAFQQQNQLNNYIQQQQQQQQNHLLQSHNSIQPFSYAAAAAAYAAAMAAHIYPNATLLKSPRLFNDFHSNEYSFNYKKQYTPPPMLSPFRKGPGLFCNSKPFASFFAAPPPLFSFQSQQHQIRATPQFNHSLSENPLVTISYLNNYHQLNNSTHYESNFNDNSDNKTKTNVDDSALDQNKHDDSDDKIIIKVDESDSDDDKKSLDENENTTIKPALVNSSSFLLTKQTLKRPSLASQPSYEQLLEDKNLSEEAKAATETIAAALNDFSESNIKPFINEGEEYQAQIPKLRKLDLENDYPEEKEDLMCSAESLEEIFQTEQFESYVELITKSAFVYGASNNLELGLHILHYYNGDFEKSIKSFLHNSIELPRGHSISNYKYNETDIWSQDEIKSFEKAILKYDKSFSEISAEMQTKTTKQCIEFYYLWKKVMSDSTKKKWRSLKKNRRLANPTFESVAQLNEVSTSESTEDTQQVESKLHTKTNKKPKSKDHASKDADAKSSSTSRSFSSNNKLTNRFECMKCNLIFKTKRKLKSHQSQMHNHRKN